jgi:hypothetical protein
MVDVIGDVDASYRISLFLPLGWIFYLYFRPHKPVFGYAIGSPLVSSSYQVPRNITCGHLVMHTTRRPYSQGR